MARYYEGLAVALLVVAMCSPQVVHAETQCRFVLGFASLRDLVGAQKVGTCLEDEHFNVENGNAEQRTSGGLLVWRKIDNFTAFTDGGTTWVNGPNGLQSRPNSDRFSWERDPIASPSLPSAPPAQTATQRATAAPATSVSSQPSAPGPTATPAPTATPRPQAQPVRLSGKGRTATDRVTPPSGLSVAAFTHEGSRNFIVKAVRGDSDLLVNTIGTYRGQRLLVGPDPLIFDIDADGSWTVELTPIRTGAQPPFSGRGDAVSMAFDPPSSGPWTLFHDGKKNFIVKLHCAGDSDLVENTIGPVNASAVVTFARGPCLWEVEADGNWKLAPR